MNKNHKRASFGNLGPRGGKAPVESPAVTFNHIRACWRLQRLRLADPYGWHELTPAELAYVHQKLSEFEGRDWNEIFVVDKKKNHRIPIEEFDCPEAKQWMRRNLPDQDQLWTLRLSGAERIWGILREGVFHLLFWDPDHKICESLR
jgi:hypothetical protein